MKLTDRQMVNFWKKVRKTEYCWMWIGGSHKKRLGSGVFKLGNRSEEAYRVSWMIHFGEIPPGMCVCHSCDNPPCVNPSHLFLGTHLDNMRDMTTKKRYASYPGEKHPNARFREGEVWLIRRLFDCGVPQRMIGRMFRGGSGGVNLIGRRIAWTHLPEDSPAKQLPQYRRKTRKELGSYRGVNNRKAILSEDDVRNIRHQLSLGEPIWAIALQHRVSAGTISHIKVGRTWTHVI